MHRALGDAYIKIKKKTFEWKWGEDRVMSVPAYVSFKVLAVCAVVLSSQRSAALMRSCCWDSGAAGNTMPCPALGLGKL